MISFVLAATLQYPARFGSAVAMLGDLDIDGWPEIAVSAPDGTNGGNVYVFAGRTGALLARFGDVTPYGGLGASIAPGADVDGDTYDDVVVSLWVRGDDGKARGALRAFSPHLGSELWTSPAAIDPEMRAWWLARGAGEGRVTPRFPTALVPKRGDGQRAAVAELNWDANGDGVLDIAYAESTQRVEQRAVLRVLSGRDGSTLAERDVAETSNFGTAITAGADLDGDGAPEIAVAAPNRFEQNPPSRVIVYRARDLSELYRIRVFDLREYVAGFGESLAFVRDVDGDGASDLVCGPAGGYEFGFDYSEYGGPYSACDLTLFSGRSSKLLARSKTGMKDVRVHAIDRDVDHDGVDEVLIALPYRDEVRVVCGRCLLESRPLERAHAFFTLRPPKN